MQESVTYGEVVTGTAGRGMKNNTPTFLEHFESFTAVDRILTVQVGSHVQGSESGDEACREGYEVQYEIEETTFILQKS